MQHLKTVSFAVIAAMGLLAFIGAGTAQAVLFTNTAKTIKYPTGTVVDFSLKSGSMTKLTTSGGETLVTCMESTAKGKTSNESGEVISVGLETLSWGGCSTTTDTVATGSLEVKWTSGTSGEVIGKEGQWKIVIF